MLADGQDFRHDSLAAEVYAHYPETLSQQQTEKLLRWHSVPMHEALASAEPSGHTETNPVQEDGTSNRGDLLRYLGY